MIVYSCCCNMCVLYWPAVDSFTVRYTAVYSLQYTVCTEQETSISNLQSRIGQNDYDQDVLKPPVIGYLAESLML